MSYTIQTTETTFTFEEYSEACEKANDLTAEFGIEVQVIHEPTNAITYVTTPVPAGTYFKPWERIENPKFAAPAFAGFIPAYTRKRIQATAYRNLNEKGWRIHDGRTNGFLDVPNTKAGAQLFTEMRLGRML